MHAFILIAALAGQFDQIESANEVLSFDQLGTVPLVLRPKLDVPTRGPITLAYTKRNCPPCLTLKAEKDRINSPHIELKDEAPEWTSGHAFPVLHWETPTGWRSQDGWYGAGPFLTTYDQSMQATAKSAAPVVQQQQRVVLRHGGLYYGRYPSTYDWPGDLRAHLTQSPHNYSWDYVNSLSDQQVIAVHDQWHIQHAGGGGSSGGVRQRRGFGFFNVK